ncbi:acyl-CoA dehydrogenase family protein [Chondromyces apiculatus]|uniref:Acyl-CoA dehydrogenase n=1 Tax=Chondromyces apiculatus DSM 436 TaxID=1192034 RepID=A0A017SX22_9BACT|nr:acyl-CoA dehydrogenase family protein [Chondromyces apiculatus]EYF01145.1 Acyl-CoA dehydrogenase [Chondromyces apiculatus DSM 436]
MDFDLSPELRALRHEVRAFVDERIIPAEAAIVAEDRERQYGTLRGLQAEARAAGLWTPHLPPEHGGRGLGIMGMCALFREMGRSPIGARVFHCDAPDQGNMDLLLSAASKSQQDRWLKPLCAGEITSTFCMTEPAPGAGADPSNLRTRATKDGDGWVIDGHKWYSTGGGDAAFLIVMARTSDDPRSGATMFLVDRHAEGVEHVRDIPVMAEPLLAHREAELRFHSVRVGDDAVLSAVGDGFRLAQKRLVPARLTHCMRWLGLAVRALDLCKQYISTRHSFGQVLARHQMIQKMIAENAAAIHAGNLMTFHCAWMIEQGKGTEARPYSSMAKNHVARTLLKVLDDAIQMHGGLGFSDDMPFAAWYRHSRAARIADGPDEVHDMVVARDYLTRGIELLV